jgi:hypothetical protein
LKLKNGLVTKLTAALVFFAATACTGEGFIPSDSQLVFTANAEWKPVDLSDVQVKKGSALDLSPLSESGPAGRHGRLIVSKGGHLAFADSPDVPRRFFGFNGLYITMKALEAQADQRPMGRGIETLAELVKRQGYDIVRPLVTDGYLMQGAAVDGVFNPVKLDNIDRLIAELKKNGVYTYLTVAAYRLGRADGKKGWEERNEDKLKMYLGEPYARARWKAVAEQQLSHVNPYTGIAWRDEPAIAVVEFYNEQEIWKNPERFSKLRQDTVNLLNAKWRAWLLGKYRTAEAVASAWGEKGVSAPGAFEKLEIRKNIDQAGPKANDIGLFFADLARAEMAWCEGVVRGAGYKGLISQFNASKQILDSAVRWETSELVSANTYPNGCAEGRNPGSKCLQRSSVEEAAKYWRDGGNATRLSDRPFFVTEHHQYFWNRYQHEDGLVFASYSALQGFAGVTVHEDPVALEVSDLSDLGHDWIAQNPIARANEFIAAHLYKRGDVRGASRRVELQIPSAYLSVNANGMKAISAEQGKIALMTGFSLAFPDLQRPGTVTTKRLPADIAIFPDGGAEIKAGGWSTSLMEPKGAKFSLQGFVSEMKAKGILPASNQSDPDAGVFQSETGEVTLRAKERLIKVVTPRTEAVSLEADKAEALSLLSVEGSSVPASVAAIAIDGQPLGSSSRMVLVYSTEMAFSGMELSKDRAVLDRPGKMPVLMHTGKLKATLKCKDASKMALYALRIDGTRREKLPVSAEGSVLRLAIDTTSLKGDNTPFFELVAE